LGTEFKLIWEASSGAINQACDGLHTFYDAKAEWAYLSPDDGGAGHFGYYGYACLDSASCKAGYEPPVPDSLYPIVRSTTPIALGPPSLIKSGSDDEVTAWPVGPNFMGGSNPGMRRQYGCSNGVGGTLPQQAGLFKVQSYKYNEYCSIFG
tara:strand:+ start:878 stop:1330 length:453 start_codon:yes stop_codon:yes gene_type:complete